MATFVLSWGDVGSAPSELQNLDIDVNFPGNGPSMGPNAFVPLLDSNTSGALSYYKWGPDTALLAGMPPAAVTASQNGDIGGTIGLYFNIAGASVVFPRFGLAPLAWGADTTLTTVPGGASGNSVYHAVDSVVYVTSGNSVSAWGHNAALVSGPATYPGFGFQGPVTGGSFYMAASVPGQDFTPAPGAVWGANTSANVTWSGTSTYKVPVGGSMYDPHTKTAAGTNTAVNTIPAIVTANPTMPWRISGSAPEDTEYLVVGDSILVCVNVGGTPTVVAWGGNSVINNLDQTTLNSFIGTSLAVMGDYVVDFSDHVYGDGPLATDQPDYSSYDTHDGPYYVNGSMASIGRTFPTFDDDDVQLTPGRCDLFVWGDNTTINTVPAPLQVTQDNIVFLCLPDNSLVVRYDLGDAPETNFWTDFKNTFATDGSPVLVKPTQTTTTNPLGQVDFQTESHNCPPPPPAGGGFTPPGGGLSGCYTLFHFVNSKTGQTGSALVSGGGSIPPSFTGSDWYTSSFSTVCY